MPAAAMEHDGGMDFEFQTVNDTNGDGTKRRECVRNLYIYMPAFHLLKLYIYACMQPGA